MFGIRYIFCKVSFNNSKCYYYRTIDRSLTVDDRVIVPVGKLNARVIGEIKEIEKYKSVDAPFPVSKTKYIIKRAGKNAEKEIAFYNALLIESLKRQKPDIKQTTSDDLSWIDTIEEIDAALDD